MIKGCMSCVLLRLVLCYLLEERGSGKMECDLE